MPFGQFRALLLPQSLTHQRAPQTNIAPACKCQHMTPTTSQVTNAPFGHVWVESVMHHMTPKAKLASKYMFKTKSTQTKRWIENNLGEGQNKSTQNGNQKHVDLLLGVGFVFPLQLLD